MRTMLSGMEIEVWYDQDLHNKCNFIISFRLFESGDGGESLKNFSKANFSMIWKNLICKIAIKMNYLINFSSSHSR